MIIIGLVAYGYSQATSSLPNQTGKTPQIEITPASFDFGRIKFGQVVNYTFKIKNKGRELLEIKRVSTSCGCTTARVSQEKLAPSEEANLLVTYDTAAMGEGPHGRGKQERIIYVKSNDPLSPQVTVTIDANVQ